MIEKIWFLQNGTLNLDQSVLVSGKGAGNRLTVPVYSVLAKQASGYLLIDTGLHPGGITDPEGTWGARARTVLPTIAREDGIAQRLAQIGVGCEEVKNVVITHLHWDHTGGLSYFKHAKIIVQKAEHRFAYEPDRNLAGSYMRNHFDLDLDYDIVEGDTPLCEGVELLFTPGHTPGHQSVLLTLKSGKRCIIPGDAIYSYQNIDALLPPGNCWSISDSLLSLHKLITVARLTDAKIYPSHDPDLSMVSRANHEMRAE